MSEWRRVENSNVEVSSDGRVRRNGVEWVPYIGSRGYRKVTIATSRNTTLHHLIAAAFIPNPLGKPCIDHINGDKLDNRVSNLQWATHQENARNKCPPTKQSSLPRGVAKYKKSYRALIYHNGKRHHLGTYDTPEEASEIYEATAEELFGEYYRKPE